MGKPIKVKEKFWDIDCANKVVNALTADILLINAPLDFSVNALKYNI